MDTKLFNKKIAVRSDIKTPEELIRLYHDYPQVEGTREISVQTKNVGDNKYRITLIHDGLGDDSQRAVKIIMTAKQTGQSWTVIEIRENWKCHDGRGHTSWGTALCN